MLIDEKGEIIAGHGRVMAAEMLKMDSVPVIVLSGLTDEQKKAYRLADNRLPMNAGWDEDLLRMELPEPEIDPVLKELLYAYSVISRARRYAGMAGVPLPLSLTEINEYLATHPVLIERDEFEAVIFALDDQYFQEQCV